MPGALAARRRAELMAAAGVLLLLNVLVWIVRPDCAMANAVARRIPGRA